VWYLWGRSYRYSSERIADKLLRKYNKPTTDTQVILSENGQLSPDGTKASAVMTVLDKGINVSIESQEVFTLPVRDNCSPLDKSCISL
jgi:hypothetical protein